MPATLPSPSVSPGIEINITDAPGHVETSLTYLVDRGEKPVVYMAQPGAETRRSADYAAYCVEIQELRPFAADLSLDVQGFALRRQESAVSDFYDDEEVRAVYDPEMERLVKQATGATKVLVFDHATRFDSGTGESGSGRALRKPVRRVHNDYTARSAPQRVRDLLDPEEAEALLKGHFAVVNVWRSIQGPVETAPLAVLDARSVANGDLVATDLVYPERTGEIYEVAHNPTHRWFTFPRMARNETLLIKGYDSREDGRARFTPHTAFDDPTTPPDAAPRESIEVRTFAFFAPDASGFGGQA